MRVGAIEIAQRLIALAALAEDSGSVPSVHIVARNHSQLPVSGELGSSLLTSTGTRHKNGTHTHLHTCRQIFIHTKQINKSKKDKKPQ